MTDDQRAFVWLRCFELAGGHCSPSRTVRIGERDVPEGMDFDERCDLADRLMERACDQDLRI